MFWNRGQSVGTKRHVKRDEMLDDREGREDKEWAKRYILDPLTDPEPHQLDGPGTSFFNPRRSLSVSRKPEGSRVNNLNNLQRRTSGPAPPHTTDSLVAVSNIHQPKPISPGQRHSHLPPPARASADAFALRIKSQGLDTALPPRARSLEPGPRTQPSSSKKPQRVSQPAVQPAVPPAAPTTVKPEPKSLSSRSGKAKASRKPPQTHRTQGTAEVATEILADKTGSVVNRAVSPPVTAKAPSSPARPALRRTTSHIPHKLNGMASSTRSLDPGVQTRRPSSHQHRHQSRRRGQPLADTIDSLDKTGFGAAYHHGGPYDATLAAVNRNKKYAPLEAVKDSNMEALRATPREYIVDSLRRHIPLQGTGTIPPGMPDMRGNIMNYEEGADLMREPDAAGGAYKRYDFIKYHPDDLKGKGEPSFTLERTLKEQPGRSYRHRAAASYGGNSGIEMKDQYRPLLTPSKGANASLRRQSFSSATTGASWRAPSPGKPGSSSRAQDDGSYSAQSSLRRDSGTGHRITDGLKRRLGSLRRK